MMRDEWEVFLKPYAKQFDHIKIDYSHLHPIFTDSNHRKFQIDFENNRTDYAKFKKGRTAEPLSRALGAGKLGHCILDLSAGLGVDAVFLAQMGFKVTAVERNPLIFLALQNAHKNLSASYRDNLKFIFAEALQFLKQNLEPFDVVYFDPMFPSKNKSALPKQEMIFFKNLVGDDADANLVIQEILKSKKFKRLVVKRPLEAEAFMQPNGNIKGKIIRYDIYSS